MRFMSLLVMVICLCFGALANAGMVVGRGVPVEAEAALPAAKPATSNPLATLPAVPLPAEVAESESQTFGTIEPAASAVDSGHYGSGPDVLNHAQRQATKQALQSARQGVAGSEKQAPSLMKPYVQAAYFLSAKSNPSPSALRAWLQNYPDYAPAGALYTLAEAKRERPHQVCQTKTQTVKVKQGKGKKAKTVNKKKKVKSCHSEGSWGPETPITKAMKDKEARKAAATVAQNSRRAKMGTEGQRMIGQVWTLRQRGKYAEALDVLLAPGARLTLGGAIWQEELVRLADFYHGKGAWGPMARASQAAAKANGAGRDAALWMAGFGAYKLGDKSAAARYWQQLVEEEPKNGKHYSRAAWWAARVMNEQNDPRGARAMLELGAQNPLTFYGQLAAQKLGREATFSFDVPGVPSVGLAALTDNPQARRGLALAQVKETEWAEAELRAATPNLPLSANRALATLAVQMDLPSVALRAGRDLLEEGDVQAAALYPIPPWKPEDGWHFDKAFMLGLMRQESAFQPKIGSRVGAQGLMQIMPATGTYIARMTGRKYKGKTDLHNPTINMAMGQDYLQYLSSKLQGNTMQVAASYNGGIGNVQRWIARGTTPDSDPLIWLESIPFDETRDYVEKVMMNKWIYQQRLGQQRTSLRDLANHEWPRH